MTLEDRLIAMIIDEALFDRSYLHHIVTHYIRSIDEIEQSKMMDDLLDGKPAMPQA